MAWGAAAGQRPQSAVQQLAVREEGLRGRPAAAQTAAATQRLPAPPLGQLAAAGPWPAAPPSRRSALHSPEPPTAPRLFPWGSQ